MLIHFSLVIIFLCQQIGLKPPQVYESLDSGLLLPWKCSDHINAKSYASSMSCNIVLPSRILLGMWLEKDLYVLSSLKILLKTFTNTDLDY